MKEQRARWESKLLSNKYKTMENQPNQIDKSVQGPKALFWYLTLFFTLCITAFNTGNVWFQFINKWVKQEISGGFARAAFSQGSLKFAVASLIVTGPIFFFVSYLIRKALKNGNLNPKNKIRVWTTYIILFISIAIAIGDLITTVFKVLDGDFTASFILKSLSILIIVGSIFTYYWLELRSPNSLNDTKLPKVIGISSAVIILLSFVGAFFLVDSPALSRAKAYDQTKANDLSIIRHTINTYYSEFDKLPEALEDLHNQSAFLQIKDPKTGEEYEYRIVDEQSYELCANFNTSIKGLSEKDVQYRFSPDGFVYEEGKNCFTKKVSDINSKPIRPIPVEIR